MILKLIIILVILYYLLLLLWFGKNQKDIKPTNKTTPKRARSIIGKSTYIVTIPLEADQTISKMQQTALFDIMIEQLDGGRQRVAEMMSKYDKGLVNDDSESASANELEEFDLDSYL